MAKERTSIQNTQNLADLVFFSVSELDENACNSPGYPGEQNFTPVTLRAVRRVPGILM